MKIRLEQMLPAFGKDARVSLQSFSLTKDGLYVKGRSLPAYTMRQRGRGSRAQPRSRAWST